MIERLLLNLPFSRTQFGSSKCVCGREVSDCGIAQVIDKLPPNSWVALTPDRKLVAGVGATEEEAAQNAELDYGLQNPILIKVPEPSRDSVAER